MIFVAVLVILVVLLVVGAVALAIKGKRDYTEANELVPGQATGAPAGWAGSHDPEAVLHRRMRDALASLRANQAFDDDGELLDIRVTIEQEAASLDQRLVATAALAPRLRPEPLARATEAVEAIEDTVASTVGMTTAEAAPRLQAALTRIRERTALVGQAWAELDAGSDPAAPVSSPATDPVPLAAPTPPPPTAATNPPAPPAPPPA
ncbi:MAG TPA: hypothetical protein VGM93_13545 [Acidimicrobiales bacterium]|jgi:hypothetical protein